MRKQQKEPSFSISVPSILRGLIVIVAGILLIHLALQFMVHILKLPVPDTLVGRFDVDNEISIPTWFSQILLLIPAILSFVIYKVSHRQKDGNSLYWLLLGALFVFLSVDEGAMLHEAFITKFREWTVSSPTSGIGNHTWLIPVGIVFFLMLIPFMRFVRRLPKRTALLLGAGLSLYVFGAIIYETIGLVNVTGGGFVYQGLNVAFEEALEMFGSVIVVYSLLDYLCTRMPAAFISLR